ncbi:MAG: hypothetical protein K2X93_19090 [Candidatus Obscuribacterales bacterium]|nr:hypothetical protein [Candidatus Obscuribacterales bacterium]
MASPTPNNYVLPDLAISDFLGDGHVRTEVDNTEFQLAQELLSDLKNYARRSKRRHQLHPLSVSQIASTGS